MKDEKKLLRALGQVDDRFLEEAAPKQRSHAWMKWTALAACLCVVCLIAFLYRPVSDVEPAVELTMEQAQQNEPYGELFPQMTLYGFMMENAMLYDNTVLGASFVSGGEHFTVRIAEKAYWENQGTPEFSTVEDISKACSNQILIDGSSNAIQYTFDSDTAINEVPGFYDMVTSAPFFAEEKENLP